MLFFLINVIIVKYTNDLQMNKNSLFSALDKDR